ncbi:MAG TPA: AMP-binding protein, partial [Ktedonobacterales bacterium]|nr:AMP-binding protein [Ktedonobacterales bacterium]
MTQTQAAGTEHALDGGAAKWSYSSGTSDIPLLGMTIGDAFDQTVARYPANEALVVRQQGLR